MNNLMGKVAFFKKWHFLKKVEKYIKV